MDHLTPQTMLPISRIPFPFQSQQNA